MMNILDGLTDEQIADVIRANVQALEELLNDAEVRGIEIDLDIESPLGMAYPGGFDDDVEDDCEFTRLHVKVWRRL